MPDKTEDPLPIGSVLRCPRKFCRFQWVTRVENPRACPNCRYRFRYGVNDKTRVPEFVREHSKGEETPGRGKYA